jgi:hypothetical protein
LLYLATLEELWWSCSPSSSLKIYFFFSNNGGEISQKHHLFCHKKKIFPKLLFLNVHDMPFSKYFVAKIHHFGAGIFFKNLMMLLKWQ